MNAAGGTALRETAIALITDLLAVARRGDAARVRSLYAEDAVAVSPAFGEIRGADAIAGTWQTLFETFDDFKAEISHILVDGDRVAVLSSVSATDRTGWFGLPPTGGPISYKLVLLFTIANGKITRDERIYDSAGVLVSLEKARIDKELKTAAEVQRMLLSRTTFATAAWESAGDSLPCRAIGGDFFELIETPRGDIGLAMGDVAGKGPAAALLASMLQGMLSAEVRAGDGPAATLTRINRELLGRQLDWRFATIVFAVLSPDGRVVYSNGGHNPPALLMRNDIRRLTVGGPILGAFVDATYEEATLQLDPNETLVMFTDGVTEARNASGEEFGEPTLLACLEAHRGAAPGELVRSIIGSVRAFCGAAEQSDDITITVTRRR